MLKKINSLKTKSTSAPFYFNVFTFYSKPTKKCYTYIHSCNTHIYIYILYIYRQKLKDMWKYYFYLYYCWFVSNVLIIGQSFREKTFWGKCFLSTFLNIFICKPERSIYAIKKAITNVHSSNKKYYLNIRP